MPHLCNLAVYFAARDSCSRIWRCVSLVDVLLTRRRANAKYTFRSIGNRDILKLANFRNRRLSGDSSGLPRFCLEKRVSFQRLDLLKNKVQRNAKLKDSTTCFFRVFFHVFLNRAKVLGKISENPCLGISKIFAHESNRTRKATKSTES